MIKPFCRSIILVAILSLFAPLDAGAQWLGGHSGYHWNYVVRHVEFGLAHSVMTDRVVFDDQGYIDLELTDLHPMAVRDLFPYPWLFRDDQLRRMNYNPVLFWSIPTYLPSYDEMRRIYTLGGGYFFDPWFNFYGGFWERAWAGMYGRFPYDTYWSWWYCHYYFVDFPYGGWWMHGSRVMDKLSTRVESTRVKREGGSSVMATLVASGQWKGIIFNEDDIVGWKEKEEQGPGHTRAYRDFLPGPGPEWDDRRSMGGGTGGGASTSGSVGTSRGGSKRKTKKK